MDYESLKQTGSIMGSGGLIVMDEDTCMVDIAKFFLGFTQDESCGKCTPCREGTKRMLEILTRITEGQGEPDDLWKLERLCHTVQRASLCGLGQSAPNPVLSTLRYFRDEYEAHINEKRCPAGACLALLRYTIDPDKCVGCTLCARVCPVNCISGEPKKIHEIDQSRCIQLRPVLRPLSVLGDREEVRRRMVSQNSNTSLGWKDLALIIMLVTLFNTVMGQAGKLGPSSWWQRYAIYAVASILMFLAIAVFSWLQYRRTEPIQVILLEAIKPAVGFGIIFGALLSLPWGMRLIAIGVFLIGCVIIGGRKAKEEVSTPS